MAGDDVRQDHMGIFLLLDILAGSENVGIHEVFYFAASGPQQANSAGPVLFGEQQGVDDVGRIATRADADGYVTWLDDVGQLLGEDMLVSGIIAPGGNQRHMIGEGDGLEARHSWHNSVFR